MDRGARTRTLDRIDEAGQGIDSDWARSGEREDRRAAENALGLMRGPGRTDAERAARLRALRLVWDDRAWAAIQTVAAALVARGSLAGPEVEALLAPAF